MKINLEEVEKELSAKGYATREGTLTDVTFAAAVSNRWSSVAQSRSSFSKIASLRPHTKKEAPQSSLSAVYGLGSQPLHTDGAHLGTMPDVIVLHSERPSSTPTVVWHLISRFPSALKSGVFTVKGNEGSFLSHALVGGKLRFDPVCMIPSDHLAKQVVQFFEGVRNDAHVHQWDNKDCLLFIDNRSALHARDAISSVEESQKRKISRAAFQIEDVN